MVRKFSELLNQQCIQAEDCGLKKRLTGPRGRGAVLSNFVAWIYAGLDPNVISPSVPAWLMGEELQAPHFTNNVMMRIHQALFESHVYNEEADSSLTLEKEILDYLLEKVDIEQVEQVSNVSRPEILENREGESVTITWKTWAVIFVSAKYNT